MITLVRRLGAFCATVLTLSTAASAGTIYVNGTCGSNAWSGASPTWAGRSGTRDTLALLADWPGD